MLGYNATFTPYHNQQSPPSVAAPTVQYPLLYRVTKAGKTHHILGACHAVGFDCMPEYVKTIMQQSRVLLTEHCAPVFTVSPHSIGFVKDFLRLDQHTVTCLLPRINKILAYFNLDTIDNFSQFPIELLYLFCGYILNKTIDPEYLPIDLEIAMFFHEQKKFIFELTPEIFSKNYDAVRKEFESDEASKNIELLKRIICQCIQHKEPPAMLKKFIDDFYNHDLLFPTTKEEHIKNNFFPCGDEIRVTNEQWGMRFESCHVEHDGIMLVCGAAHLVDPESPEQQCSLLHFLETQGFTITRITHNVSPRVCAI